MQRNPVPLVGNLQLPNAYATQYTVPANTWTTLSAVEFNNTSGAGVAINISIIPSGSSQSNANEVVTALVIPAAGSAPTVIAGLIAQTLAPGTVIQMKAASVATITPLISGYEYQK